MPCRSSVRDAASAPLRALSVGAPASGKTYIENKLAQPRARRLSRGFFTAPDHASGLPQASASLGQSAAPSGPLRACLDEGEDSLPSHAGRREVEQGTRVPSS